MGKTFVQALHKRKYPNHIKKFKKSTKTLQKDKQYLHFATQTENDKLKPSETCS